MLVFLSTSPPDWLLSVASDVIPQTVRALHQQFVKSVASVISTVFNHTHQLPQDAHDVIHAIFGDLVFHFELPSRGKNHNVRRIAVMFDQSMANILSIVTCHVEDSVDDFAFANHIPCHHGYIFTAKPRARADSSKPYAAITNNMILIKTLSQSEDFQITKKNMKNAVEMKINKFILVP